jgi:hypothetical protein
MNLIRGPSGIVVTLMAILAMMFCVSSAGADQSADISQQAIINVVKIDGINNPANFNAAHMDGIVVQTELVVDYQWETVVSTSDAVGISSDFAVLSYAGQFADKPVASDVANTTMINQNSFITTTAAQGALLPGNTLVVQQSYISLSNVKAHGDAVGVLSSDLMVTNSN